MKPIPIRKPLEQSCGSCFKLKAFWLHARNVGVVSGSLFHRQLWLMSPITHWFHWLYHPCWILQEKKPHKDSKVFSITFLVGFLLFSIFLGVTTRIRSYHMPTSEDTAASGLLTNRITSPRSDSLSQTWCRNALWRSLQKPWRPWPKNEENDGKMMMNPKILGFSPVFWRPK